MTKKDYVLLAGVLKKFREPSDPDDGHAGIRNTQTYRIARKIAETLESKNPKFDRLRFLRECDCLSYPEMQMYPAEDFS